jgi:hypothetical protein
MTVPTHTDYSVCSSNLDLPRPDGRLTDGGSENARWFITADGYIFGFMRQHRGIIVLLLAGIIIRVGVIWWAMGWRENTDIERFKDWTRIAYLHSFADTYKTDYLSFGTLPNNVPPGTVYSLYGPYLAWVDTGKLLARYFRIPPGSNSWINGPLLTIYFRIPACLSDIGIAVFLYLIVRKSLAGKKAITAAALFYLSPVTIFNSAFMGQLDAVSNLFFIICLWALFSKRFYVAATALAASLMVKLSLIYLVPFVLYFIVVDSKVVKRVVTAVAVFAATTLAAVLPVSANPAGWYWHFFIHNATGEMPNVTAFAFNFWWMVFRPAVILGPATTVFSASEISLTGSPDTAGRIAGMPIGTVAIICFGLVILPFVILLLQRWDRIKTSGSRILLLSIVALAAYLLLPKMHDRYMYPALVLLAAGTAYKPDFGKYFAGLTLLNLLNLFIVWHPVPVPYAMYLAMNNRYLQWSVSVLTVLISAAFYRVVYRYLEKA